MEGSFRLLNKLLTDRHPRVLQTLCLLVATQEAAGSKDTVKFAQIAVRRYEAVSDTELLRYYVPLLQLCLRVFDPSSDRDALEKRLECMKRRGIKVDGCPSLLEIVKADYKVSNMVHL